MDGRKLVSLVDDRVVSAQQQEVPSLKGQVTLDTHCITLATKILLNANLLKQRRLLSLYGGCAIATPYHFG